MAVTAQPKLDAKRLRADFPIFEHPIHGKPLAYLDSANLRSLLGRSDVYERAERAMIDRLESVALTPTR